MSLGEKILAFGGAVGLTIFLGGCAVNQTPKIDQVKPEHGVEGGVEGRVIGGTGTMTVVFGEHAAEGGGTEGRLAVMDESYVPRVKKSMLNSFENADFITMGVFSKEISGYNEYYKEDTPAYIFENSWLFNKDSFTWRPVVRDWVKWNVLVPYESNNLEIIAKDSYNELLRNATGIYPRPIVSDVLIEGKYSINFIKKLDTEDGFYLGVFDSYLVTREFMNDENFARMIKDYKDKIIEQKHNDPAAKK